MDSIRYSKQYSEALKFMAVGKHGTPQWNPTPHPLAGDPAEVIAKRETDPLWQYHRGLRGYHDFENAQSGWNVSMGKPKPHRASTSSEVTVPDGLLSKRASEARWRDWQLGNIPSDAHFTLSTSGEAYGFGGGHEDMSSRPQSRMHDILRNGTEAIRNSESTLHALGNYAKTHDPYALLAMSVRGGNRHALPHLVDLLQQRDNPAGWYSGWTALAKAMEERIGDLQPHDVLRRVHAIAEATAQHSQNPEEHRQLARAAYPNTEGWKVRRYINSSGQPRVAIDTPTVKGQVQQADTGLSDNEVLHRAATHYADFTPYLGLADHLEENGLPQYAQLMRAELANVIPGLRKQPRRKGSRL